MNTFLKNKHPSTHVQNIVKCALKEGRNTKTMEGREGRKPHVGKKIGR